MSALWLTESIASLKPTEQPDKGLRPRLLRWADWARCARPGQYVISEGYMRERLDKAHEGEPTEEIAITDKAVAQMYVDRPEYKPIFNRFYLDPHELSEVEIARECKITLEMCETRLRQAETLVWYKIEALEGLTIPTKTL